MDAHGHMGDIFNDGTSNPGRKVISLLAERPKTTQHRREVFLIVSFLTLVFQVMSKYRRTSHTEGIAPCGV